MYRQICPSKNNKNFIRSIGLPEHLKELQEKLRLEEEEKVRQQLLDQSLVQVNFTCNEEHCMDKTHSVLLHVSWPAQVNRSMRNDFFRKTHLWIPFSMRLFTKLRKPILRLILVRAVESLLANIWWNICCRPAANDLFCMFSK